jgi:hypothetical protein
MRSLSFHKSIYHNYSDKSSGRTLLGLPPRQACITRGPHPRRSRPLHRHGTSPSSSIPIPHLTYFPLGSNLDRPRRRRQRILRHPRSHKLPPANRPLRPPGPPLHQQDLRCRRHRRLLLRRRQIRRCLPRNPSRRRDRHSLLST